MASEVERDPRNLQLTGAQEDTPWCDTCGVSCDCGFSVSYQERKDEEPLILQTQCIKCRDKHEKEKYQETGEITNRLMLLSSLRNCNKRLGKGKGPDELLDAVSGSMDRIQELVLEFEEEVWFGYMAEKVRSAKFRGQSAESDHIKFLIWVCAGRVMFTISLKEEGSYLSLIISENNESRGTMGVQGIYATEDVAMNLLSNVLEDHRSGILDVVEDPEVTIAL